MTNTADYEDDESNLIKSNTQTLLGFESADSKIPFVDPKANNRHDESDDGDTSDALLQHGGITMMGFAQNQSINNDNQYQLNQNIMLFGKILQYDKATKSYSLELQPNSSTSNPSQKYVVKIPSQFIHSKPPTIKSKTTVYIPVDTIESKDDSSDDNIDTDVVLAEYDSNTETQSTIKHTENRKDITLVNDKHYDIRKNLKCILCLYASDAMNIETDPDMFIIQKTYRNVFESSRPIGDICDNMFRIDPFGDGKVLSNNKDEEIVSVKNLVKYDETLGIYYHEIGAAYSRPGANQIFFTPKFKWPKEYYSMVIWVDWKNKYNLGITNTILTTFDSLKDAPIYVDSNGHIGVHSNQGNQALMHYKVKSGWNFVVALGSRGHTTFYVGDLHVKPVVIGSVNRSICGRYTQRIGECDQGPGKCGYIGVFDGLLREDEIQELYYETMSEMSGTWNEKMVKKISSLLLKFCDNIQDIALTIVKYAKCTKF